MSDTAPGPGWWQASDDRWYPPEQHPGHRPPPPPATGPPGAYPAAPPFGVGPPYGAGPPYYVAVPIQSRNNGKAIASLILSLVWIWGITSILAIIFGFVAKREIRASRGTQTGDGLATAGIVIGFVGIVGVALFITLAVVVGHTVEHSLNITSQCEADAASVQTAAEAYHAQTGHWPADVAALTQTANGEGPWLRSVPSDANYTIFVSPTDGTVYVYPPDAPQPASFSAPNSYADGGCVTTFVRP